ncbi:diaminopimelate decarboxylase family protein [Dethiosulfatarculus sandiegensis]|uniref:Decarboxylase n=1 Tax=Dethiosulfatarculus sandiegensis TaxID=1429043 RepID=A0A0D2HM57_9BACT|nr:alanine racemase [Dethiosulfatarculus sandiegensis]KIX11703.1 decarboxylase [Dethiosulfatarculus sandiegensis]
MNSIPQPSHPGDSCNPSGIALLPRDELEAYIRPFQARKTEFKKTAKDFGSPLYLFDKKAFLSGIEEFKAAFEPLIPGMKFFYALKSNNYLPLAKTALQAGMGLDVSSGAELKIALALDSPCIIFSGPGKNSEELQLAVANAQKVTVLIDSFDELKRLQKVGAEQQAKIKAGVRITSDERGLWRKFGIPLNDLSLFINKANSCANIDLCGLQFHTSWNMGPSAQVDFICKLGRHLLQIDSKLRSRIRFLDIGGGYWPDLGEWLKSPGCTAPKEPRTLEAMHPTRHYRVPSQPIESFAKAISLALKQHISPVVDCVIHAEPGRWLSNGAMHILLTVLDKKAPDMVITDGGINLIGWERFETDFAPVINLTSPSLKEKPCWIMGSLCTPHDIWGYSFFGKSIKPGDRLLIPDQGAYTYSLRQSFIKPVALVVTI